MPSRGLVVSTAAVAASLTLAASAAGHATLVTSNPPTGTTLANPPAALRLELSEETSEQHVELLNGRGRPVHGVQVSAADDGRSVVAQIPKQLPRDRYELIWNVLSADDGHVTNGAVSFGVRTSPADGGAESTEAGDGGSPLEAGLRWLDFLFMAGLLGGIAVSVVLGATVTPRDAPDVGLGAARRRVLLAAAACAALAVAMGAVLLFRQATDVAAALPAGSSPWDAVGNLLSSPWGGLWLAREALLLVLLGVVLLLRRASPGSGRARRLAWQAGAAAVMLAHAKAAAGHAASVPGDVVAVGADALHQLAAGIWIGGVFAFALALWALRASGANAVSAVVRGCRRPFAVVAGISVATVGITGLYAAGAQVQSVDGLLTTFYGRTLIAKTALVLAVLGLGLANALLLRRLARRGGAVRLRRLLLAEAAVGALVLAGAAVMTSSSPPRGPEFAAPHAAPTPTLAHPVRDVLVSADVRPNRPGTNIFTVLATSSRRPAPAPIDRVTLRLAAAGERPSRARTIQLTRFAPDRFAGGADLQGMGRWQMTAIVHRAGQRLVSDFGWRVARPDPARPIVVSASRLAPVLDRVALLGLVALAALGLAVVTLRARGRSRAKRQANVAAARGGQTLPIP
jgi:copper transport protein